MTLNLLLIFDFLKSLSNQMGTNAIFNFVQLIISYLQNYPLSIIHYQLLTNRGKLQFRAF
jgi:hypothetical protein